MTVGGQLKDLRRGDEAAWREAFRLLWPAALHAARHAAPSLPHEEAEDAANEALAQLVRCVEQVRSFEELRVLAATIAYRRAISSARRNSAAKRIPAVAKVSGSANGLEDPAVIAGNVTDHLDAVHLAELALLLGRAMAELDGETRRMLTEKVCDGLTYRELAERHQRPTPTVAARVARALAKVRRCLAKAPGLMHELRQFLR